jgi:hypothetical protein
MLAVAFWSDPYHPVAGEDDEVLALLDWYAGCRRADGVVSRAKVDPVVLRPWIGRICLYHREPDGRFRVRLRGERVGSGEHSNDGALYIDDNRPPAYRDCQLTDFRTAITRAEPSLHRVSIRAGDDTVSYRRVLIPVALTPGAADMLLLFNPDAQPGGRPEFVRVFDRARWLAIGVVPPESA